MIIQLFLLSTYNCFILIGKTFSFYFDDIKWKTIDKMFDFFPHGVCDKVTLEVRVLEGALLMALSLFVCDSCSKAACFTAYLNILK